MLDEVLFALSAAQKVEINPHRFRDPRISNVHAKWIGEIRRAILPTMKWPLFRGKARRAEADAKGGIGTVPATPAFPKEGAPGLVIFGFYFAGDPYQLQ